MSDLDELVVELLNKNKILQADNENLKQRNAILRERPDLPVDRIPAATFLENAKGRIEELEQQNSDLKKRLAATTIDYTKSSKLLSDKCAELEQRLKYARENPTDDRMSTWQAVTGKYRTESVKLKQQIANLQAKLNSGVRVYASKNKLGYGCCTLINELNHNATLIFDE